MSMAEVIRDILTKDDVMEDARFSVGTKVQFETKNPEYNITKEGTITGVYPYIVKAVTEDGKEYTINKVDFFAEPLCAWFLD